jgi:predicted amidohydrolase YtcJ
MTEEGFHPDAIYVNGDIVTLDPGKAQPEAVATWRDRIVSVGSTAQMQKMAGSRTTMVDLGGKTLIGTIPGW